jgi:PAS domain-containing protein
MVADPPSGGFFLTLLRRALSYAPVSIAFVKADGTWLWSTQRNRLIDSISYKILHGRSLSKEETDSVHTLISAIGTGQEVTGPAIVHAYDGNSIQHTYAITAENLLEDPDVEAIVLYTTEVTQTEAIKSEYEVIFAALEEIIESMDMGVMVHDPTYRSLLVNTKFMDLFGVSGSPEDLKGQPAVSLYFLASNPFVQQVNSEIRAFAQVTEGKKFIGDEYELVDGTIVARDYIPIKYGDKKVGTLWLFRDITEEVQARGENENYEESIIQENIDQQDYDEPESA